MNIFCRILGHTWTPFADNPKVSWNNDDDGLVLTATASAEVRFYDVCLRCRERREVQVRRRAAPKPTEDARKPEPSA